MELWLKGVPRYTTIFVQLVMVISVINSYSGILATSQGATGKVKVYQLTLTLTGLFHVPFTLLAYRLGAPPQTCSWIYVAIVLILQVMRILFVSRSTRMPLPAFLSQVVAKCLFVFVLAALPAIALHMLLANSQGLLQLLAKVLVSFLCSALIILFIGMQRNERQTILMGIKKKLHRNQ